MPSLGLLLVLFLRAPCWAGDPMSGQSNSVFRNAVTSGGEASASANNAMTSAVGEDAAAAQASPTYRLAPGGMALFSFPGAVTDLAPLDERLSSATLTWTTRGYDGALGPSLRQGTSYYIRVASYTIPDTFAIQYAVPWVSTGPTGTQPGAAVSSATTGLDPNTTWYATLWALDADGNLSFASNRSTFTSLAKAPQPLAATYLNVFETSVTLNWAALPGPPAASSESARGYVLEASSTDFGALTPGGLVLSSATSDVAVSTLTLDGLDLGATYYFRVGSLNLKSRANYLALPRLNFQIEASSSGLSFGTLDAKTTASAISASSIVVVNRGSLPVTLRLYGVVDTPGSPWSLSTSTDVEQAVLQAVWNSAQPADPAFADAVLGSTQTSGGLGGAFAGNQAGAQVPPGQARTLWFRFWRPTSTVSTDKQVFRVNVRPVYP